MKENNSKKKKPSSIKKFFISSLSIGIVCSILLTAIMVNNAMDYYNSIYGSEHEHNRSCYKNEYINDFESDHYNEYGYRTFGELKEYKFDCPQVVYGDAFSYAVSDSYIPFFSFISGSIVLSVLFTLIKKNKKEKEKKINSTTNILD